MRVVTLVNYHGPLHMRVGASPISSMLMSLCSFSQPRPLLCAVQLALTSDPLGLTPDPQGHSHATPFCVRPNWSLPPAFLVKMAAATSHFHWD